MSSSIPFRIHLVVVLVMELLFSTMSWGQETLRYELDQSNTTDTSVAVAFSFKVERLPVKAGITPELYPHYRLFIGYGDGTFGQDILIDTVGQGHPRITVTEDSILYKISHTYYARPTQSVFSSLSKIKTTDSKPPPKISALPINNWNTQEGPADLNKNAILNAMKKLPYSAEELRFIDTIFQEVPEGGDNIEINTGQNLSLNFHLGPVPENDYIGILQLRGIDSLVRSGMILIHYNLADFLNNQERLEIDTNLIRHWKHEKISTASFEKTYAIKSNSLKGFKDVIRIDFEDLWVNEVRRIILPFFCPSDLQGSLNKPVFYHAVVIDSSKIEDYFDLFRTKGPKIISVEEDLSAFEEKETVKYQGFVQRPENTKVTNDNLYYNGHSDLGPRSKEKLPFASSEGSTPLSIKAEVLDTFRTLLDGLGGRIIGDVITQDYVRQGHDPNSIKLEPDCFGTLQKRIEGVVNFENYGFAGVDTVTIRIKVAPFLNKHTFGLFKVSDGRVAKEGIVEDDNGKKYYEVVITDIYLPGILELANEEGYFNVEELVNDEVLKNLRAKVQARFGETVSQGHIVFQATTKGIRGASEEVIVEAEVIFKRQPPILTRDTIRYNALECDGIGPFLRGQVRLGYNYPFSFSDFSPNFDFQDNYLIGAYADFSPNYNARWYYRVEATLNRWGFEQAGERLTQQNLEITPSIRYGISNRWTIGLGASYLTDVNWKLEDNKPLPFTHKDNQLGGFVDLAYGNLRRNLGIGFRANYYPNALKIIEGESQNLGGLQLYFTLRP